MFNVKAVKKWLIDHDMSQVDFAAFSGVPHPTLTRVLSGSTPSLETFKRIQSSTGLPYDDLILPDL